MTKTTRFLKIVLIAGLVLILALLAVKIAADQSAVFADTETTGEAGTVAGGLTDNSGKALGAGIAVGLAALGGGIGMGIAGAHAADGIARQPEAEGKIRTIFMLALVFIETAIIYALLIAILNIFVL
ncbi:MAG: ATP synthase F0 subunit C [Firmicutes bacterium]|nr:ATP synthase F0 subunit C [Bacillota bacterium]